MKLFCIPYAGGSQLYFRRLKQALSGQIECISLDYAGHGMRFDDHLAGSFEEIIEDIDTQIKNDLKCFEKFALFGYSMGSIVAYEIAKRYSEQVQHLFVAAFQAPTHLKDRKYTLHSSLWNEFLIKFAHLDHRILTDPRYRRIFLEPLKNDFECLCGYSVKDHNKLCCGITVFYGTEDVFGDDIREWEKYTEKDTMVCALPGGHFFLQENLNTITDTITIRI